MFYNIDIVDRQKKSRPTKTFATGKIFLVQQTYFSTDKNISRPMKLISHPINVFLERQKHSQAAKNYRSLLSTMAFHIVPGSYILVSFFFLFFLGGAGGRGYRRGSRLGVHVLYRPLLLSEFIYTCTFSLFFHNNERRSKKSLYLIIRK